MGKETAERKKCKPGQKDARRGKGAGGKRAAAADRRAAAGSGPGAPGIRVGLVDAQEFLARLEEESRVPEDERERRRGILADIQREWSGVGVSSDDYSLIKQAEIDNEE